MGPQKRMELVDLLFVFQISELLHKPFKRRELIRLDVIKKRKQFLSVILDRSTRQKHDLLTRVFLQQHQRLRSLIFKSVSFIDYDVLKRYFSQDFF